MKVYHHILLGLIALVMLSSGTKAYAQSWSNATVGGVYAVNGVAYTQRYPNGVINPAVLSNPGVAGFALSFNWSALETADGRYNWAPVDAQISQAAAAGKSVSLVVIAGAFTPSWVYAKGAKAFSFLWDQAWGPQACSVQQMPLPWDRVFLRKWTSFVHAFGARYNSNPTVKQIKLTGLNSKTAEIFVPYMTNEAINVNGQTCTGYNDLADWQAAGYTRTKIENSWSKILKAFHKAFRNQPLTAMMVPGAFPPIDENGNLIPGALQDKQANLDIITEGINGYGSQFILENDGLSDKWIWQLVTTYANQLTTGYQMVSPLGTQLPGAVSLGLTASPAFLEIYPTDITDPTLSSTITAAQGALP